MIKCRAKNPETCPYHGTSARLEKEHKRDTLINSLVPKNTAHQVDYYLATVNKHFGDRSQPGSKFLDKSLTTIEDVLRLAYFQRNNGLDGDDRELLISKGAPAESFIQNVRYLYVKTLGTVGIKFSYGLPDETLVHLIRTKPGAPVSLTIDVDQQVLTEDAVIIIGKESNVDVLWTLHPGLPSPTNYNEYFEKHVGEVFSLKEIRAVSGEVWLNTRIIV